MDSKRRLLCQEECRLDIRNLKILIRNDLFYIDKTTLIKEWWERRDRVTLIARPRRFGKTLTMSMVENFFSVTHVKSAESFWRLNIWKEEYFPLGWNLINRRGEKVF